MACWAQAKPYTVCILPLSRFSSFRCLYHAQGCLVSSKWPLTCVDMSHNGPRLWFFNVSRAPFGGTFWRSGAHGRPAAAACVAAAEPVWRPSTGGPGPPPSTCTVHSAQCPLHTTPYTLNKIHYTLPFLCLMLYAVDYCAVFIHATGTQAMATTHMIQVHTQSQG
jgi:hypothetical protein